MRSKKEEQQAKICRGNKGREGSPNSDMAGKGEHDLPFFPEYYNAIQDMQEFAFMLPLLLQALSFQLRWAILNASCPIKTRGEWLGVDKRLEGWCFPSPPPFSSVTQHINPTPLKPGRFCLQSDGQACPLLRLNSYRKCNLGERKLWLK